MKILCLIDNLGPGGAQRQLTTLASGLKNRGHEVRFLTYHPHNHFLPLLDEAGISCETIGPMSHLRRIAELRRILRQGWQDVVLAFLEGPCLYAEIAALPSRPWGLVAGERLADPRIFSRSGKLLRQFHRAADAVVCNSHTNRLMLESASPFLRNKLATIYNTVDLQKFCPRVGVEFPQPDVSGEFRIVVAASLQKKKNLSGLAKAMVEIKNSDKDTKIAIDWYGDRSSDGNESDLLTRSIQDLGLEQYICLHPPTKSIENAYLQASAVGLFSYFEGLPNVVCEAMACGKPIVMSNTCDAGNLVRDGVTGFLCDPDSPASIAKALRSIAALPNEELQRMGLESRRRAEHLFDRDTVLQQYEQILIAASLRQPPPLGSSWPMDVPDSARHSMALWKNG